MRVMYAVLIMLASFSAFVTAMAAGMQLAGIRGASFPFPFALGPSWAWFWVNVVAFICQIVIIVLASYKATARPLRSS